MSLKKKMKKMAKKVRLFARDIKVDPSLYTVGTPQVQPDPFAPAVAPLTGRHYDMITSDDLSDSIHFALKYGTSHPKAFSFPYDQDVNLDNILKQQETKQEWRKTLEKIPNLKGQIIGGHTIIWDHQIKFCKVVKPIYSRYGDVASENAMMQVHCSCGWFVEDILPLAQSVINDQQGLPIVNRNRPPDFKKVEDVILNHIPKPWNESEMEYAYFSQEWLEDLPAGFLNHFLKVILNSGGMLQFDFDTRSYLLIDDKMSDTGIAEIKDMLEGHPVLQWRKVRVIRSG